MKYSWISFNDPPSSAWSAAQFLRGDSFLQATRSCLDQRFSRAISAWLRGVCPQRRPSGSGLAAVVMAFALKTPWIGSQSLLSCCCSISLWPSVALFKFLRWQATHTACLYGSISGFEMILSRTFLTLWQHSLVEVGWVTSLSNVPISGPEQRSRAAGSQRLVAREMVHTIESGSFARCGWKSMT